MLVIPSKHVLIPKEEEILVTADALNVTIPRNANVAIIPVVNQTQITLPFTPISPSWVEIYIAGRRVINAPLGRKTGGLLYKRYNIRGNVVNFNSPISGELTFVCDTEVTHDYRAAIISVKNIQYSEFSANVQYSSNSTGQYCEPVILTQPSYGYARLTTDRQSIAYVPNRLFKGTDSFTYTLISQNGQPGPARCIFVAVS